ncbi:hypothetical protein [Streptococcus parauberis]|uniref:hypothetical protein n=2 Tax=Streptococcus parauberis TaxID=1348 RepID=UPI00374D7367|nr:hypothetical protein P1T44_06060 [Streptococcus parauberis]
MKKIMIIKRETHFAKIGTKITIYIGNTYTAKLKNNQEIKCKIDKQEKLKVKASLQKAKVVDNQDLVIIQDNPLNLLLFWLGVATILISHLFLSYNSSVLYYISLVSILLIFVSYLLPQVKLTIKKNQ